MMGSDKYIERITCTKVLEFFRLEERDFSQLLDLTLDYDVPPIFYGFEEDNPGPLGAHFCRVKQKLCDYLDDHYVENFDELVANIPTIPRERTLSKISKGCEGSPNFLCAGEIISWHALNALYDLNCHIESVDDSGKVFDKFPELRKKCVEGLIKIDESMKLTSHGIIYKNYLIKYHQFLRSGFCNAMNVDLTCLFVDLWKTSARSISMGIAIDSRRLILAADHQPMEQKAIWHGPPYNESRIDDPSYIGVTKIKCLPGMGYKIHGDYDRTEFFWKYEEGRGVKSFECEEISLPKFTRSGRIINRYAHAERVCSKKNFQHFDIAVKIYDPREYDARYESIIPDEPRTKSKLKLFRVDGEISTKFWSDSMIQFFEGNTMLLEYFDPNEFELRYKQYFN